MNFIKNQIGTRVVFVVLGLLIAVVGLFSPVRAAMGIVVLSDAYKQR